MARSCGVWPDAKCTHVNINIYLDNNVDIIYCAPMHIDIVPNRNSHPTVLLRETRREGKKVIKRALANLSSLPMDQVEALLHILKGEKLVRPTELFENIASTHHGHAQALEHHAPAGHWPVSNFLPVCIFFETLFLPSPQCVVKKMGFTSCILVLTKVSLYQNPAS